MGELTFPQVPEWFSDRAGNWTIRHFPLHDSSVQSQDSFIFSIKKEVNKYFLSETHRGWGIEGKMEVKLKIKWHNSLLAPSCPVSFTFSLLFVMFPWSWTSLEKETSEFLVPGKKCFKKKKNNRSCNVKNKKLIKGSPCGRHFHLSSSKRCKQTLSACQAAASAWWSHYSSSVHPPFPCCWASRHGTPESLPRWEPLVTRGGTTYGISLWIQIIS